MLSLYFPRLNASSRPQTANKGADEESAGRRPLGTVPSFHIPNISTLEDESSEIPPRTPPNAPKRPPPRRVTGGNAEHYQSEDEESNISSPLLRTPKRQRRMPRTSTPVKVLVMAVEPPNFNLSAVEGDVPTAAVDMEEEEEEEEVIFVEDSLAEEVETTDPARDSGIGSQEEDDE